MALVQRDGRPVDYRAPSILHFDYPIGGRVRGMPHARQGRTFPRSKCPRPSGAMTPTTKSAVVRLSSRRPDVSAGAGASTLCGPALSFVDVTSGVRHR